MQINHNTNYNVTRSVNHNTILETKEKTQGQIDSEKVKLTVEAVNENGKVLQTESTQGPAGANIDGLKVPSVTGYTLAGIKVNGKSVDMNTFKLPTELPNQTENIQYIFKSNVYKTTVEIKDEAGNIVATKTTTGKIGTAVESPALPKGSKLVNVEVNGVVAKNNEYPSQIVDKDTTVVINVAMPHTATVKYVDTKGQDLGSSTTTGLAGTDIRYATAPKGYKVKSITVDGKVVSQEPAKLGSKDENIVITYEVPAPKKVKLTVEAVDENGKVLFSENGQGDAGSEIQGLKPVPAQDGYTLEKILVNGKEVNKDTFKLPTKLANENETIQYVYKANEYTATVKIVENGKVVDQKITTGKAGTKIEVPAIPAGTHAVQVSVNGEVSKTNSYPANIGDKDTTIVITVEKDKVPHKINITFDYSDGSKQTGNGTAVEGSTIPYPTIQKGYKIEKIT
ncbi:MAG: MucBP domain-containing protein, partial [Sarcina sp.]